MITRQCSVLLSPKRTSLPFCLSGRCFSKKSNSSGPALQAAAQLGQTGSLGYFSKNYGGRSAGSSPQQPGTSSSASQHLTSYGDGDVVLETISREQADGDRQSTIRFDTADSLYARKLKAVSLTSSEIADKFHELDGAMLNTDSDDAASVTAIHASIYFRGRKFPLKGLESLMMRHNFVVHNGAEEITLHTKLTDVISARSGAVVRPQGKASSGDGAPDHFLLSARDQQGGERRGFQAPRVLERR